MQGDNDGEAGESTLCSDWGAGCTQGGVRNEKRLKSGGCLYPLASPVAGPGPALENSPLLEAPADCSHSCSSWSFRPQRPVCSVSALHPDPNSLPFYPMIHLLPSTVAPDTQILIFCFPGKDVPLHVDLWHKISMLGLVFGATPQ